MHPGKPLADESESAFTSSAWVSSTTESENPYKSNVTPLLWRAYNKDSDAEVWLFGSLDKVEEEAFPLPNVILNAYVYSDIVVVTNNYLYDAIDANKLSKLIAYQDGTTIVNHIPAELYQKGREIIKNANVAANISSFDYYKPMLWVNQIQGIYLADCEHYSTTAYFINWAKEDGKVIDAVEDTVTIYAQQYNLSEDLQIFLLKYMVEIGPENYRKLISQRYKAWSVGNSEIIERNIFNSKELTKDEIKLAEEYIKIYEDLNQKIAKVVADYLTKDDMVFVCVDIEHLVGKKGVIALLEKAGYVVDRINTQS